jgi:hypothetical protein
MFTAASETPGTFLRARSTRATHEAQVMPPTPIVNISFSFSDFVSTAISVLFLSGIEAALVRL